MPKKTMDAYLADLVREAVQEAVSPLMEELRALKQELSLLKEAPAGEPFVEDLITQQEARKRLMVNHAAFKRIVEMGEISLIATPNGRNKVPVSSLNAYIRKLAGKAG